MKTVRSGVCRQQARGCVIFLKILGNILGKTLVVKILYYGVKMYSEIILVNCTNVHQNYCAYKLNVVPLILMVMVY